MELTKGDSMSAVITNVDGYAGTISRTPSVPSCLVGAIIGKPTYLFYDRHMIGFAFARITPEVAEKMVGKNFRTEKAHRVGYYAKSMADDLWKISPQSFAFDVSGERIDGGHRRLAVIKSGKTIVSLVSWGWPRDIDDVLDDGLVRQNRDYLRSELGVNLTSSHISAIRMLATKSAVQGNGSLTPRSTLASWTEILGEKVVEASSAISAGDNKCKRGPVMAVVAASLWRFPNHDVLKFCEGMRSGIGMENNHEQNSLVARKVVLECVGKSSWMNADALVGKIFVLMSAFVERRRMSHVRVFPPLSECLKLPDEIEERIRAATP